MATVVKKPQVNLRALLAALLASLVLARAAYSDPSVQQLSATEQNGKISVQFILENAFESSEVLQALESGLPTGFNFELELIRKRPNWFDSTLASSRLEVICTYNGVTREYLLNYRRDRHLVVSETFNDLERLKERMTRIVEQDIFTIGSYAPFKLRVRVRAGILRGFLLYVIPWEVSTDWKETRVRSVTR